MTPPPAMVDTMASMTRPQDSRANIDIMAPTKGAPWQYLVLLGLAVLGVAQAFLVLLYQTYVGLGVAGYQQPIFWGVYIITFVFWIGIGHAGTLISAILFLFRAKWRNTVNRGAEALTVFAVITAALFPVLHLGRIWKVYFLIPYPNQRALWVNFKSPLLWDVFAISTYASISIVFFYIGMIPDIAMARDRATGGKKILYTILALGWQGTGPQWKAHSRSILHLSGLATPLVLSVHSVVSWDFAMSIVPGWHATIFAPYFVAGAVFGGFAMVLNVLIPVRRIFRLENYLTDYHFENMSRFILLTSSICGYAYLAEYFTAWYSGVEFEQSSFWLRAFGPYWISTWCMITFNVIFPQLLWIKRLRTNVPFLFVL
ncbi:MAG: NrfD/PsrC family molybdoenzyme membrane anchor subunit, partial [Myxococcota bacterium]